MAKHKPTSHWHTHKLGTYPYAVVNTHNTKNIHIAIFPKKGMDGYGFVISRQLAKMLARRINQCLEDTK